jgi:hypothetical protein
MLGIVLWNGIVFVEYFEVNVLSQKDYINII